MSEGSELARVFTVYFDGSCPVCAREIGMYRRMAQGQTIQFMDISRVSGVQVSADLSVEQAMAVFHVRDEAGELFAGVDAFAQLWLRLPQLRWLGRLAGLSMVRALLDTLYRVFLRRRARKRASCSQVRREGNPEAGKGVCDGQASVS